MTSSIATSVTLHELKHRKQKLPLPLQELPDRALVRRDPLPRTFSSSWWPPCWGFCLPEILSARDPRSHHFSFSPIRNLQLRLGQLRCPARARLAVRVTEELQRHKGVTLRLLWLEYRTVHPNGYQYSRFCDGYRAWQEAPRRVSCCRSSGAGEKAFVDYAASGRSSRSWTGAPARYRDAMVGSVAIFV